MVELQMVKRMARRGLLLAPLVVVALWMANGSEYALSGAIGMALTLGNLYLSAFIIGGVAERNPMLLMPAAMATFVLGLLLLTGVVLILRAADIGYFPVTGFTLIGSHLLLVLWESAGAYDKIPQQNPPTNNPMKARS